jgi:hypothetical protein
MPAIKFLHRKDDIFHNLDEKLVLQDLESSTREMVGTQIAFRSLEFATSRLDSFSSNFSCIGSEKRTTILVKKTLTWQLNLTLDTAGGDS